MENLTMNDHIYKSIEITGTSTVSVEDAVEKAIRRVDKTVKHMRWFQVVETRGNICDGRIQHWQVAVKIGFAVEE
jgi:flavin-binding protein dodecin